jgi:hypothetical protein
VKYGGSQRRGDAYEAAEAQMRHKCTLKLRAKCVQMGRTIPNHLTSRPKHFFNYVREPLL